MAAKVSNEEKKCFRRLMKALDGHDASKFLRGDCTLTSGTTVTMKAGSRIKYRTYT